jgi:hypothetical protein
MTVLDQTPEPVQVHQVRVDVEQVAGVPALDLHRHLVGAGGGPLQDPADPAHVRVQDVPDLDGRNLVPDPIDERLDSDRPARVHGQRRQHRLLSWGAEVQHLIPREELHLAK